MQDAPWTVKLPVMMALAFMAGCLYTDILTKRIPNFLTVPFACGGVLYHCLTLGLPEGGLFAFKGLILGCLLLFIPFALGGMGGGDVKCLGALGAWMGPERIFWIFLYGAVGGGLLALFLLIQPCRGEGFEDLFSNLKTGFLTGRLPEKPAGSNRFPYTIPIAAGFMVFILFGKTVP
jgi:prepilin peptidase CpaA